MKFNKIICVDHTKLKDWAIEDLQKFSEQKIDNCKDYPEDEEEILNRIGDSEIVFVSWHTKLDEALIKKCPNLKYIGMCCSLYDDESANVAVKYARENGIVVKGIRDYGDPGVIEFIFSELVRLLHGFGGHQWKENPVELSGKKLGIIGLGTTGKLLAGCLLPFGVDLYYFSRTRKYDWEEKGVKYLKLQELLKTVEIISIHLPKNTKLLQQEEFQNFGNGKILINTSLGLPFDEDSFIEWISDSSNFAIFDGDGKRELNKNTLAQGNIISTEKSAGWSAETHQRLSEKVVQNFKNFMEESYSYPR